MAGLLYHMSMKSISQPSRVPFAKPAETIDQLVARLKQRGLIFGDEVVAKRSLKFIGYYRLSGYTYTFQIRDGSPNHENFVTGTTFEQILDTYVFDRKLRILVLDAIERIETAVRTVISDQISLKYGPHWYLDRACYKQGSYLGYHSFVGFIINASNKHRPNKQTEFIKHYFETYASPELPPSWMSFQCLTFGNLSNLYSHLLAADQKSIARVFDHSPDTFQSMLNGVGFIRNTCAHHARLWNKKIITRIQVPSRLQSIAPGNERVYDFCVVMYDILKTVAPGTTWPRRLKDLVDMHPGVDIPSAGFQPGWSNNSFWHN